MTPAQIRVRELHTIYIRETGLEISMDFGRERSWAEWLAKGWNAEDLRLVIRFLKRGIARQERREGSLRFRNLIQQLDYFEEELAAARKIIRKRVATPDVPTTRTLPTGDTVTVFAPPAEPETPDIGPRIAEQLKRFREESGR